MRVALASLALVALGPVPAGAAGGSLHVQAGVGLVAFPRAADVDPGAAWGVGVEIEPWRAIELEAGYQGAAFTAKAEDPSARTAAIQNGGYGLVKLAPFAGGGVEPYLLGGFGLAHVNAVDEGIEGGAIEDDMISKVPLGLGVDMEFETFSVGIRGTWDLVFGNQFAFQPGTARGADQLFATLHLGAFL